MEGSHPEPRPGRDATSPREIPRRGWRDILLRVKQEISNDNASLIAAGVAFYSLLALFPAIAALVSLYAILGDPAQIQSQIEGLQGVPQTIRDLLSQQLGRIADNSQSALGWAAAGSFLLTLWSASKGVRALMLAMNVAYDEDEERGFLKRSLLSVAFTLGALVMAVIAVVAIAGVPALFGNLGLGTVGRWAAAIASWVVLFVAISFGVACLYRWGPSRRDARWRWITPGSVAATAAWILASALFSLYLKFFGSYNATYGSIAGVVVLLLWLWIAAFAIVLGGELNAEMERQTLRDTTTGERRPPGRRGASAADQGPDGELATTN